MTTENQPARMGDDPIIVAGFQCSVDPTLAPDEIAVTTGARRQVFRIVGETVELVSDTIPRARELSAHGGDGGVTLPMILWSMRNWASVADTCAVTEGHAPACIRTWADQLEALATQQPASGERQAFIDGYMECAHRHVQASTPVSAIEHHARLAADKAGYTAIAAHGGSGEGIPNIGVGVDVSNVGVAVTVVHREGALDTVIYSQLHPLPPTSASDAEVDRACIAYFDALPIDGSGGGAAYSVAMRAALEAAALTRSPARVGGES